MFTSDLRFRWIAWDGHVVVEADSRAEMLEIVRKVDPRGRPPEEQTTPLQLSFKHYSTGIMFDEVTPSMVKTRNLGLMISLPKSQAPPALTGTRLLGNGIPVVWVGVYHDTWRIEGGIWKKAVTTCYTAPSEDLMEDSGLRRAE